MKERVRERETESEREREIESMCQGHLTLYLQGS